MLDLAGTIEAERYPDRRGPPMPVNHGYALRVGPYLLQPERAGRGRGQFGPPVFQDAVASDQRDGATAFAFAFERRGFGI